MQFLKSIIKDKISIFILLWCEEINDLITITRNMYKIELLVISTMI